MGDVTGHLVLIRHGETEWSRTGRHTGRTDVPLTTNGEAQARVLARSLAVDRPAHALTSPAVRARNTADLAGFREATVVPELWEWDYGGYEGLTTPEIQRERPGWNLWIDGVIPGDEPHPGESITQVGERADSVLDRVQPLLADGDVAVFAHGHMLRVLTARWLDLEPSLGRLFRLDTATLSRLCFERERPMLCAWNIPARSD